MARWNFSFLLGAVTLLGMTAHDALKQPGLSECPNCHEPKVPHRVCPHCGQYKGREVVEVVAE